MKYSSAFCAGRAIFRVLIHAVCRPRDQSLKESGALPRHSHAPCRNLKHPPCLARQRDELCTSSESGAQTFHRLLAGYGLARSNLGRWAARRYLASFRAMRHSINDPTLHDGLRRACCRQDHAHRQGTSPPGYRRADPARLQSTCRHAQSRRRETPEPVRASCT